MPVTSQTHAKTASVTLDITWPAVTSSTASHVRSSRKRAYLSASTRSLAFTFGSSAPVVFDNPNVAGQPAQTQSLTILAPVGMDDVTVAAYDKTQATGNLLGRVATALDVVQDAANMLTVTLDGELHSIGVVPAANQPLLEGTLTAGYTLAGAQPEVFDLVPLDADGNVIIAPGAVPPLTLASAGAGITVAPTAVSNQYTISAAAPTAFVNLTASGTDLDGAAVTTMFKADAIAAIYVTNTSTSAINSVSVFDENGNAIALPAGAFSNVKTGTGISFVPATNSSPPMLMVADEFTNSTNQYAAGAIFPYDLAGNPITAFPPTGATSGTSPDGPFYSSFAPALDGGTLIVPEATSGTVVEYDRQLDYLRSFNAESPVSQTMTKLIKPIGIYYDASPPSGSPAYFVTDASGNTAMSLQEYSADGKTLIGTASAGLEAHGISWDKDDKLFIIGTKVTGPTALVDNYSIVEYDETLTNKTPTGAFLDNGLKSSEDVLYDPNNKEIYASDSYGNQVLVFTVAGNAVTTAGKFPNLNAPRGLEYVP